MPYAHFWLVIYQNPPKNHIISLKGERHMKKRILAILLCLVMVLLPVLASCEMKNKDDDKNTSYTWLELQTQMNLTSAIFETSEYDSASKLTSDEPFSSISSYFVAQDEVKTEEVQDEEGNTIEKITITRVVKDIKTGTELYKSSFVQGDKEVGKTRILMVTLGGMSTGLAEKYFAVLEYINGETEEADILKYTVYGTNGVAIASASYTSQEYEEAKEITLDTFEDLSLPIVSKGSHILILNELYRVKEDGTATLVKKFKTDSFFELDPDEFEYLDGKYVQINEDEESGTLSIYVFDQSLNFVRAKEILPSVDYEISVVGLTSAQKIVYASEKITEEKALRENDKYDFIVDGFAYDRTFYIYNIADGTTSEIATDLIYIENGIIFSDAMIDVLTSQLGIELDLAMPEGVSAMFITDLVCENGVYTKKQQIQTYDENLSLIQSLDMEVDGITDVEINYPLNNDNVIVEFPWGTAIYSPKLVKVIDIEEIIAEVNGKFIITEKAIYDHNYSLLYTLEKGEEIYYVSDSMVYISYEDDEAGVTNYYSYNGTEKKLIFTEKETFDSFIATSYYFYTVDQIITVAEDEISLPTTTYTLTYYLHNGEAVATYTGEIYPTVETTRLSNGYLLTYTGVDANGDVTIEYTLLYKK